jgi:ATP-dependent DNA helicase RecG
MDEILPDYLMHQTKLMPLQDAIKYIHFPTGAEILKKAIHRLKFDELFYIQLSILAQRNARRKYFKGHVFSKVGDYVNNFYTHHLKFELTDAQKRVIKEIRKDLGSGKQMNRLLQGDVGSGKTLVALMAMLIALDNGFQSCFMAPTEILANQHLETLRVMLDKLDIRIRLLTGSTRKKDREELFAGLASGELDIIVGTHALLEDTVKFKNLGLVVIDEQHRFGVAQRAKLWKKNTDPPHVLVMTATPIPRTLAMTLYGDLDVSVIDELPPGRKPITTFHYFDNKRLAMFGFLRKQIAEGRQIYIVYPLIKESEKLDLKDLEDGYEAISRAFPPPEYVVTCVHGKMKSTDKDSAMNLFVHGKSHILVATTVIEVGVDVSNASVMVIESAERFGLSQLHQLRGRVGRGADQSYCILMSSPKLSEEARKRIKTMCNTNDGFEIAEVDLKLRGPGDLEGTQQSGIPFDLKIASLGKDGQILQYARNMATDILDKDPDLSLAENSLLKKQLSVQKASRTDWSIIS